MRVHTIVAILALSLISPLAAAHGANTFAIILRGSSIQPNQADVLQGDFVVFYNVADYHRIQRVDLDGDGIYDQICETEPLNTSSIRDECAFSIDSGIWPAGYYDIDVFSNGSLWKTLNLTVVHDFHEEIGPPSGYTFNDVNQAEEVGSAGTEGSLMSLAMILFLTYGLALMKRRRDNA